MECLQDEHGKLIFKWTDLKIILSLINNDFWKNYNCNLCFYRDYKTGVLVDMLHNMIV
jgi:hypothetical protein